MSTQTNRGRISDQEYQSLVNDFNSRDDVSFLGHRLDRLFEVVVDQFPYSTALIHNGEEMSFQRLNQRANMLARNLQKRGLEHGDVVGLAVARSIDLLVTIISVLKVGAAYVPIDPSFPAQRIDQMIEDAEPKFILLSDAPNTGLARWSEIFLNVKDTEINAVNDPSNLDTIIDHKDLAYVIYTSGSTGRPKGVEISHGAAANFLTSLRIFEPGCSERDRLLAITTISFDMSCLELLLPILSGATMIIANTSAVRDPGELLDLIKSYRVTILQATPATWTMLLESGWNGEPRLSKIICGGEPLSRSLADRLLASASSVWNVYGPSETTYGSVGRVGEGSIVVGNPVVNGRIYVLDDDLSPVPIGCEGEVYIGGGSVSNGYRNKSELTLTRFLDNPFHGGKFFRTGDLARFIDHGKLQVIGRKDGVVKVRGYRIEVGDIEVVLVEHPEVKEAVVISRDDRLVAYYVPQAKSFDMVSFDTKLRSWVAERLPSYMVPAFFVTMSALPLSPNEKVDRKALPDPLTTVENHSFVRPRSDWEKQVQAIWVEVLGHSRFGIEDNFFRVGGDSVRLIRVQSMLERQLHRSIPAPKLFEHFTIKTLSAYLAGSEIKSHTKALHTNSKTSNSIVEDIAIVSMACRLPGGVATPEDLWRVLESGIDTTSDVPNDRWGIESLHSTDLSAQGLLKCSRGGFLDSVYSHDAPFFGISPREAQAMDPEQHLMLEVCWEGFERAGYTREHIKSTTTGVFIGVSSNGTTKGIVSDLQGHSITGSADATLSGRISYSFDFHGPCMTVDTACSASLVATHLACSALQRGECDKAVAGGVSLLLNPGIHLEFSKLGGLSADGRCRSFSDNTDGTGFSEGAAIVLLKRVSDAQRDGDEIHAVLRSTVTMHGGHSVSLTAPNGPRQELLIRTALDRASLEPQDIDYIEAHGTATKLGDPIEAIALAEVFGPCRSPSKPLELGSVKSNLGHTQATAGLVGLMKVVLSMQNETLPRTLHVVNPTRAVNWKENNMQLVLQNRPWITHAERRRRAGVSAFGIGGTIAHVVVEDRTPLTGDSLHNTQRSPMPADVLLAISGNSDSALQEQAKKLQSHLKNSFIDNLADVAFSLATSRTHFRHRAVVTAKGKQQAMQRLGSICTGSTKLLNPDELNALSLGFLFTGQGCQRIGMGKDLYATFPVFRNEMNNIVAHFKELEYPLLDIMWAHPGSTVASLLDRTDFSQPAIFALEVSLWKLWRSWGVEPTLLLGHSLGELTAAHASGILSLSDACQLVLVRGRLMQAIKRDGKTIAVEASGESVLSTIKELSLSAQVQIASYNTSCQTVVSGCSKSVDAVQTVFTSLGVGTKVIHSTCAFHSHHMDDMLDDFRAVAQTVTYRSPNIRMISSMTGKIAVTGELEQANYWVQQVRNTVRFSEAFQTLLDQGVNGCVEIGPSPTLCGLGSACLQNSRRGCEMLWLPSMKPRTDEGSVIQEGLGTLHTHNFPVNWAEYYSPFSCKRVNLPTYAFQRADGGYARKPQSFGVHLQASGSGPTLPDFAKHMFNMKWRPVRERPVISDGSWGLLRSPKKTAWVQAVIDSLSSIGIHLVTVSNFLQRDNLQGVISLWDADGHNVHSAHEFTVMALNQLQEVVKTSCLSPVIWLTRHAIGTGHDDQPVSIGSAPLFGLMRAIRSEHPELSLRMIDVDNSTSLVRLGSALMLQDLTEIAVRKGQFLTPHVERAEVAPSLFTRQPLLRSSGAVLVTGGLGGIGRRVAYRLVTSHDVRDLVLVSRRGMQAPNAKAFVETLAKLGARATIAAGDVSAPESLQPIMEIFTADRPLRGVVHAAGVVDSGTLNSLTAEKCATTLKPKIDGTWNLHQATKNMKLDFFILFSSISGVVGLPGLANYAAANSFVDALAHLRRAQGLPATSLAYGTWEGDGMVNTLVPSTRSHLSQLGLGLMDPEVGLDIMERAVYHGAALSIAAVFDTERLKLYYETQGGIPTLLRSMLAPKGNTDRVEEARDLRAVLKRTPINQHRSVILNLVRDTLAGALGFDSGASLDAKRPLKDFGVDSLSAVLMRNHLTTLTGIALPPNVTLLYPDLNALSEVLLSKLEIDIGQASLTSTATSGPNMTDIERGILDRSLDFSNVTKCNSSCLKLIKNVFVTGSTGFVGAFMVYEFLKRGLDVFCLVRADGSVLAQHRMLETMKQYDLWSTKYEPLLHTVAGDLSQPLLGLKETEFRSLAITVDTIIHSGALVDWMRPLKDYVGPNILGTHEVLRLASQGQSKTVHFISTISTLPIHLGYGLTENDGEYGYGTSKYLAEKMVVAARFRGAMASSYRLPFVASSATNGQFRQDKGDFLNNVIVGSLDLGAFPSIDAEMSAVLPVDYLCETIATIVIDDQQRIGEDYDFLRPNPPTFNQFFEIMGAACGGLPIIPFSQWHRRALAYAVAHPQTPLARITTILDGYTDETSSSLMRGSLVGKNVLGPTHYPTPPVDEAYVLRCLACIMAAKARGSTT